MKRHHIITLILLPQSTIDSDDCTLVKFTLIVVVNPPSVYFALCSKVPVPQCNTTKHPSVFYFVYHQHDNHQTPEAQTFPFLSDPSTVLVSTFTSSLLSW